MGSFAPPKGQKCSPRVERPGGGIWEGRPWNQKTPPASSPSSPTSPNGAQARVHNACAHRSTPTAQPWTPAQPGQPGHHKRPRVHNACARSCHLSTPGQRNKLNTQAPAGARICACVREIASRLDTAARLPNWTKWTLKRPQAPIFARVYVRDTSTKADTSRAGLVLRTPAPWRQAQPAPATWTAGHLATGKSYTRARELAAFSTSTKDSQAIVEDAAGRWLPASWKDRRAPGRHPGRRYRQPWRRRPSGRVCSCVGNAVKTNYYLF